MSHQKDISELSRSILVAWMWDVSDSFGFCNRTFFLSVWCTDRFLASNSTSRQTLQLVGATALFISSKFQEVESTNLKWFTQVCDGAYSDREMLQMEREMLEFLEYDLFAPMDFVKDEKLVLAAALLAVDGSLYTLSRTRQKQMMNLISQYISGKSIRNRPGLPDVAVVVSLLQNPRIDTHLLNRQFETIWDELGATKKESKCAETT